MLWILARLTAAVARVGRSRWSLAAVVRLLALVARSRKSCSPLERKVITTCGSLKRNESTFVGIVCPHYNC